jgi:hypothetical protein
MHLPPPPQSDVSEADVVTGGGGDSVLAQVQNRQQDERLKIIICLKILTNRKAPLL